MTRLRIYLLGLGFVLALALFMISTIAPGNLALELFQSFSALTTCSACFGALLPLRTLARLGDDTFTAALVKFCIGLGIQDEQVCWGALGLQAPVIAHSLRSISVTGRTASLFCAKIFGLCPYPNILPYQVQFPREKPLKRPHALPVAPLQVYPGGLLGPGPRVRRTGKRVRFVQISDLHIDRSYVPGSEADCIRVICCRNYGPGSVGKLVQTPAGPYGHANCDAPPRLFDSMIDAIERLVPDAAFISFTGDVVDHAVWLSTKENVQVDILEAYGQLSRKSTRPVYGVVGNHDIAPTNSFPRNTSFGWQSQQWDFDLHANLWREWIGDEAAATAARMFGCYVVKDAKTGVRIISINTSYGYKANFWLYDSDQQYPDPNGLLAWIVRELQDAEDAGERVLITGHISSGKSDYLHDASNYWDQVIQRYRHTIVAQLYGHSHRAEFEIAYSQPAHKTPETASSISFVCPALTPQSGNPSFRVYEMDEETKEIMDFTDYIANLTAPTFQRDPFWYPYYSARELYGSKLDPPLEPDQPIDASFWHRVTQVWETDLRAFSTFINNLSRGGHVRRCGPICHAKWICHLRASRSQDNCDAISPGLHIGNSNETIGAGLVVPPGEEDPEEDTHMDVAHIFRDFARHASAQRYDAALILPQLDRSIATSCKKAPHS
ncbi:uncharacterized protein L969DRAFT_83875 [Mixia osmundae IAM 14324]|uniref:Sphingomyelin phosphodiesterase n=1 Tax=Mixia osmundae (strain CBS 9802 / IAM 14324 / JCM 22182 / KY 12970) TaxID=764103 RepID=G7E415_MIXOS|nr:uncharacterized protein L969DRAFT_83875 [Mixia osmundae IAM 14324]KEI42021.1 hypothetical protein L969DRAFT_83875 [Mixia osmundae IAM 14324]GAA97575.1 hypothetical protein E5Q_04253 [Mixia osmundae IAM 14324]